LLELSCKILLCYLLGSIVGSLALGRLRGVDIRKLGSGNAGATNALRTQGIAFALAVFFIDIGKGVLAATVVPGLDLTALGMPPQVDRLWLAIVCATAVVVGHVYPAWHGFRGGKGAATLAGVLIGLKPEALPPVLAVWLLVVVLSGFVGLATLCAVAAFPGYLVLTRQGASPLLTFGIAMFVLVLYTHRGNVVRMLRGTEHRTKRFWLPRTR